MKQIRKTSLLLTFAFAAITFISCDEKVSSIDPTTITTVSEETYADTDFVATDWTDETHSKSGDANFSLVFDDTKVQRLDFVVTKNRWQMMLNDMTEKYGTFGSSGRPGGLTETENPIFVPADVTYNGKKWYRAGIRFKGNSSLQSTWQSGNLKLSFKLDFDEFEDEYPQIDNQRFNGFKQMSLKNNYGDTSFLREKVAGDVFRNAGLAGSHTAFYTLYVDYGDGPVYFGLYTLTEEVDDTVIDTQFSSDKGNLYKPDGDAASFANGSFDTSEMDKQTNEDEADFSDVQQLYTIINDATRTTDAAAWRAKLDANFDTKTFLKYLAINTTIQNWDTYGRMTHNYFLYNNPANGLLTWIPWDNNEALQTGKQGGSLNLNFSGLSSTQWPIIGYMYQDAVYKAQYDVYLKETIDGAFNATTMQALYTKYATLVEPYATTETQGYTFLRSSSEFSSAINTLKSHVTSRAAAVEAYLK
ncbi:MAG: CotH kinase family protein [Spirosomaceae bacterium]|nr:CotH kinase family protein [Spirosomataceae bacterium]